MTEHPTKWQNCLYNIPGLRICQLVHKARKLRSAEKGMNLNLPKFATVASDHAEKVETKSLERVHTDNALTTKEQRQEKTYFDGKKSA